MIPNPWAPSRVVSQVLPTTVVGVLQDAWAGVPIGHSPSRRAADSVHFPVACRGNDVTIARRRPTTLNVIAAPMPTAPAVRPPLPGLRVPVPLGDAPAPEIVTPVGRLRRCTFRRIDRVGTLPARSGRTEYEVMCLYYGKDEEPLALGDISAARPVCEGCTADGIFRPDEA